ncbi:MAG: putative Ig domain-containing protein, partial [Planctomycetota bacterium]
MNRRITLSLALLLVGGLVSAQDLDSARAFLASAQRADGSWIDASCTQTERVTARVAQFLAESGDVTPDTIERALEFLDARDDLDLQQAALRAAAFVAAGRDAVRDTDRILAERIVGVTWSGEQTGWSLSGGPLGDLETTALCLTALGSLQGAPLFTNEFRLFRALNTSVFGIYGYGAVDEVGGIASATALSEAFNLWRGRYFVTGAHTGRQGTVVRIRNLRRDDGGYGDTRTTDLETAMALWVLQSARVRLSSEDLETRDLLVSHQLANGSWNDDPLTTAWALRVLSIPVDRDADGLPDDWEIENGLDPDVRNGTEDLDDDGLSLRAEYELGTDPRFADSDGDGVDDGDEVRLASNPLDRNDTNAAPVVSSTPPRVVATGSRIEYTLQATDPDGHATTCSLASGPTGMTFDEETCSISWLVPESSIGRQPVVIEIVDEPGAKSVHAFTLEVIPDGIDLAAGIVNAENFRADSQTLIATGRVSVRIENVSVQNFSGNVEATAFVDANLDGALDAEDTELGQASFQGDIASLAGVELQIPSTGAVPFADSPVSVFIDSARSIDESDESNNVATSANSSRYDGKLEDSFPVIEWLDPSVGFENNVVYPLVANLD